jgi:hypothetical protein
MKERVMNVVMWILIGLKDESAWQRGEYVGKQEWATMPGEREPDRKVAEACAMLLMPRS